MMHAMTDCGERKIMAENQYFNKALSNFTKEYAYAAAVRHLHDLGMSPGVIQQKLSYPVSLEKINHVIEDYEQKKNSPESEYEYIQDTDRFGRKSFRKMKKQD